MHHSGISGRAPGLFVSIVLDGVGVGWQPDAEAYGDEGANTLGHVCREVRPSLPALGALGLGCIAPLTGIPPAPRPGAHWGRMKEVSAGKDSTTGHWELAGLRLERPFPTYPDGFPQDVIDNFCRRAGVSGVIGNVAASGTEIIATHGAEHVATGRPIVYTSADSVFQIAAHVDVVNLDRLYAWCREAREHVCVDEHAVGRVIARPFTGSAPPFTRLSTKRRDFAMVPPAPTIQDRLRSLGIRTVAIGKIGDLFAHQGFDEVIKTRSNADGCDALARFMSGWDGKPTFVWINLVDFDQDFGHRNDPAGFGGALEDFDAVLPGLLRMRPENGRIFITADHGNDPCFPGTDHTREYVPVLFVDGERGTPVGTRSSFADHAATVGSYFGLDALPGTPLA